MPVPGPRKSCGAYPGILLFNFELLVRRQLSNGGKLATSIFLFSNFYFLNNLLSAQDTLLLTSPSAQWQVHATTSAGYYHATVPGNIYTDLRNAHAIPDPFFGDNEQRVKWADSCAWEYRTTFLYPETSYAPDNYWLVCEGLDTYADVYLNDSLLFHAENMFAPKETDVQRFLLPGKNVLRMVFHPALIEAERLYKAYPLRLPGGPRVFVRKAQYQFGWDWGPALTGCGIWKPVYLVNKKRGRPDMDAWSIHHVKIHKGYADFSISQSFFRRGALPDEKVELYLDGEKVECIKTSPHDAYTLIFRLHNPKLWWPNGYGTPYLYHARLLYIHGSDTMVSERKIGLRHIELVQEKDKLGSAFYFRVNGKPVFIKGANYVPAESFYPVSEKKYHGLILAAKDANMNMLRVWGGGVYEDDEFYRLCDENGIMVWQDLMFACGMYPGIATSLPDVSNELATFMQRAGNHPCMALWCGNNENREGWFNWGWQRELDYSVSDSAQVWLNYKGLFESTLPSLLKFYLPDAIYWPSSPLHGWGRSESLREGDLHYWGIWWGREPFEKYNEKIPRFMSEYGFQGMPAIQTIREFADTTEWDTSSAQLKNHQKHPFGFENIGTYMQRYFGPAKTFEDYVYLSQLTQAYGMRIAIEAHRRNKPYCMGTLYWQLNDCWPGISWSTIDYYGRWKAAHYEVKQLYKTVLLCFDADSAHTLHIISDSLDMIAGKLLITGYDADGKNIRSWEKEIRIGANTVVNCEIPGFMQSAHPVIWQAILYNENGILAQTRCWPGLPKDLPLRKPTINTGWGDSTHLIFSSDMPVKNLYIGIEGYTGNLQDNFFDLLPGELHSVEIPKGYLPYGRYCADRIRLISLYDMLYRGDK